MRIFACTYLTGTMDRMKLTFYKYQGTGNDFIVLDGRTRVPTLTSEQIAALCDRRKGIGADGLMILLSHPDYDFEMLYFNADGHPGSLCGNGARCLTRFAADLGMEKTDYHFLATDGAHEARIAADGWIHLHMHPVQHIEYRGTDAILHTGSPHYIRLVEGVDQTNVVEEGRTIRYSPTHAAEGINVNFVEKTAEGLRVRTYERGVEDETLSCGTGVTAAALACAKDTSAVQRTAISTRGGKLAVEFIRTGAHSFDNIWLCGPAQQVFTGTIDIDSL